jgi:thymidine phosphorylase
MTTSNLSKVKPAFRTKGNVTGNFGAPKRTKEAYNTGIGVTNAKVVNVVKQEDYLKRLYAAFENTNDEKLKQFIYTEIKKIMIQRGTW